MGENVYIHDLVDFDVTMSTSMGKYTTLLTLMTRSSGRWGGLTSTKLSFVAVNERESEDIFSFGSALKIYFVVILLVRNITSKDNRRPKLEEKHEGRKELCGLLRSNLDIFAWKPEDITGVPRHIAEHRLNIREGCLPVRQKKRGQAPERNKVIYEEVEKLVNAGIMKEFHYHSWLSNPMMVKKHDGGWRMCVDFKDLNKACPKDGYPLPEID
ncbi:hypothetical protein Tco_0441895 [Tanacetum coccineum]